MTAATPGAAASVRERPLGRLLAGRAGPALGGILALAALARFWGLGAQSLDYDELQTAVNANLGFGGMLDHMLGESTPPLYYLLIWSWTRVLGFGEVEIRFFSALVGVAAVPVAYLVARELGSRRGALIAAALVALSPWLVWFSQQARAYSLVIPLSGLSFLYFLRSLKDGRRRTLMAWGAWSALAIATHYFAIFIVAAEAAWLVRALRDRLRPVLPALAIVGAVALALVPLALAQRSGGHADEMIENSGSLALRVAQVPKQSLLGYDAPSEAVLAALAAVLAAVGIVLALRSANGSRRALRVTAGVATAAVIVPVGLAAAGFDYVVTRNVLPSWLPLAAVAGIGFATRRAGRAAALALCSVFALIVISVAVTPSYQREDWRGAARSLGPADVPRAILLTPPSPPEPFTVYLPGLTTLPQRGASVQEIDVVAVANTNARPGADRSLPEAAGIEPPLAGFRLVGQERGDTFRTVRFKAARPVVVQPAQLSRRGLPLGSTAAVLLQPAHASGSSRRPPYDPTP